VAKLTELGRVRPSDGDQAAQKLLNHLRGSGHLPTTGGYFWNHEGDMVLYRDRRRSDG
jgi:hypothetical protein